VDHGTQEELFADLKLDAKGLCETLLKLSQPTFHGK
jgi:hypothetical protein